MENNMEEKEIDLRDYVKVIWKRKKIILGVFFIAVIISAVVSLLLPKVYEASVTLMINKPKYQVALEPKIQTRIDTEVSIEAYRLLINDRTLEEKVIEELKKTNSSYKDLIIGDLKGMIIVQGIKNTDMMELKVKSNSPMKAMQIVNTWAKLFVETNQELELKETKETQIFVSEQLKMTEQKLNEAEDELRQFDEKDQVSILEQKIGNHIDQIVKYEARLNELTISYIKDKTYLITKILGLLHKNIRIVQERVAKINLSLLEGEAGLSQLQKQLKKRDEILDPKKSNIDNEALDIITSSSGERLSKLMVSKIGLDPIYFDLKLQEVNLSVSQEVLGAERDNLELLLVEFKDVLEKTELKIKDENLTIEELVQLANSVANKISEQKVIDEEKKQIGQNGQDILTDTISSVKIMVTEIKQIKRTIDQLNEALEKYKIKFANERLKQTQLNRTLDTVNQTYKVLSQKAEETRIAAATKLGLVKIARPAYIPEDAIGPHKRKNVLIAGVVSLMFGIFLAFFVEYLEPKKD